jgi:hypothetical protein
MSVFGMPRMGYEAEKQGTSSVATDSLSAPMKRESLSHAGLGPWKVGSLDSRVVKLLTVAGFALPVIAYILFLQHYQVNAMWQDQWDDVPVIRQSFVHFPDWSSLWAQHVDNRIFFPNLIVVALAHTVHYNITVEEYISALMLFASTALFIWAHKRRSPQAPLLFYCPIAFLTLTLAQWQNTIWGFQMAWYLVLLSMALTIALLDWPKLAWPIFVLGIFAAVVGSFSSIQGLLIWPVGLVLLYYRRRPLWTAVIWVVAAAATAGLYFHNFTSSQTFNPNATVLKVPWDAVKFYVFALGDIVGVQVTNAAQANPWVMAFGVVILVLAVLVLIRWGLRRDEHSAVPIGIALILFGLLFDALITQGRLYLLYEAAAQSRYTTNDVLVLAGIYLTALDRSFSMQRVAVRSQTKAEGGSQQLLAWVRRCVDQIDRVPLRQIALAAIALQVVVSVSFSFGPARNLHGQEVQAAVVARNIDHEPAGVVELDLYFVRSADWLREQTLFLREHHLSQFGG